MLVYNSSAETYFNHKLIELADNGVFFDIGANHGMYLEAMSKDRKSTRLNSSH